ncbi:MAG: hypothetical protein L0207_06940 [Chlamydiae bacterium]|nr:hypothetical protein [Chlamydiota bacterium]
MRILLTVFGLICGGYGLFWWLGNEKPQFVSQVLERIELHQLSTLEARFSPAQIVDSNKRELLSDRGAKYLESKIKFYPYLLLEIKYPLENNKTKEGAILWDLIDGEMVLDVKTWKKTHGFGDCIKENINSNEWKVIKSLQRGSLDKDKLQKELKTAVPILETWIRDCKRKNIVVEFNDRFRLHLDSPRFASTPETKMEQRMVTTQVKVTNQIAKSFSSSQIERIIKVIFGENCAIRRRHEIYLPIHCISIQRTDGSIESSHWNGMTGKRFSKSIFYE